MDEFAHNSHTTGQAAKRPSMPALELADLKALLEAYCRILALEREIASLEADKCDISPDDLEEKHYWALRSGRCNQLHRLAMEISPTTNTDLMARVRHMAKFGEQLTSASMRGLAAEIRDRLGLLFCEAGQHAESLRSLWLDLRKEGESHLKRLKVEAADNARHVQSRGIDDWQHHCLVAEKIRLQSALERSRSGLCFLSEAVAFILENFLTAEVRPTVSSIEAAFKRCGQVILNRLLRADGSAREEGSPRTKPRTLKDWPPNGDELLRGQQIELSLGDKQAAERSGVPYETYVKVKQGRRKPSASNLEKFLTFIEL